MEEAPESGFGARLRAFRRELRLSQSELGGDTYSASYVSHLESGRRHPTPDVVRFMAARLKVPESALLAGDAEAAGDAVRAAAVAATELQMHNAVANHDYAAVIAAASADLPAGDEAPHVWWRTSWLKAEAELASEDYGACAGTARALAASPLAAVSAELRAAALSLESRALRANGQLEESLSAAEGAVAAAEDSGVLNQRVIALREQIAVLAELGRIPEASSSAARLAELREGVGDSQLAGLAAWTIGNVAFLADDARTGVSEHAIAARLLRPELDLRLWARFHKASAAMRLAAGVTDDVDECVDRAGHALALIGNSGDRAELELLRAERVVESDPESALTFIDHAFATADLPDHTTAEGEVLRSRAFDRLGRTAEARTALMSAARHFDAAGADRRAADLWRRLAGGDAMDRTV